MPKEYPAEFKRDVVAVARLGERSKAQVTKDFGVPKPVCIDGSKKMMSSPAWPGHDNSGFREMRELRKRNKQFEQENEILRRATAYFARDILPQ